MRPLRHPDPGLVSDDEQSRLATVQALVEQHTLEIQRTSFVATRDVIRVRGKDGETHWYSDQSPIFSLLLSGPYWVMHHFGLTFDGNPVIAEYILTLLGVTLPIAFAAGLLYRMGRLFELKRPYRAGLALAVVIGSGWISYATVLSAGAAAAALVVMSVGCLVQATISRRAAAAAVWIFFSGLCAAVAGTYELTALAFLAFLLLVAAAIPGKSLARVLAVVLYAAGAAIPLLTYAKINRSITGDLRPGFMHTELSPIAQLPSDQRSINDPRFSEDEDESLTFWHATWRGCERFLTAFFGGHGILTHFPVLLLGFLGISTIMHRHWPVIVKMMAGATVLAALGIIVGYTLQRPDWPDAMFANRWFLVFLPLILFWAGAWARKQHRPATWIVAAALWSISAGIALLGATNPQPRQGYDRYTAMAALMQLVHPPHQPSRADLIASGQ